MARVEVTKARWFAAQEEEKRSVESADDIKEWLRVRRHTWKALLDSLKDVAPIDSSKRILDVGCGPTSVFLSIREGDKHAVDPNLDRLFQLHPFIKDVEEYKDVRFTAKPIEETTFDKQFDLIFLINVLDHVDALKPVTDKVGELLSPTGIIVVVVDCYADGAVKKLMSFFDVDLPHPHHFIVEDIVNLFPGYELRKKDDQIFHIFQGCTFKGEKSEIEIYRVDRLLARMKQILKREGKLGNIPFMAKYTLCYTLALVIAVIRRREKPIHPLKKLRLFVFQKS
jgi:SAM-dependent methyltransferase